MAKNPIITMEPTEYVLDKYDIRAPLKILGTLTPLLPRHHVPIVFLIDENHEIDECIEQNIANSHELIRKANVTLIGVESHWGGRVWDDYAKKYKDVNNYTDYYNMGENPEPVSRQHKYADAMKSSGAKVLGVECFGMQRQADCDCQSGGVWYGKPTKEHPLNIQRSEHFIRTLLELQVKHSLVGNMILNAGGDHNSDIEQWIKDKIIDNKAGRKVAYVRLTAPAYQ